MLNASGVGPSLTVPLCLKSYQSSSYDWYLVHGHFITAPINQKSAWFLSLCATVICCTLMETNTSVIRPVKDHSEIHKKNSGKYINRVIFWFTLLLNQRQLLILKALCSNKYRLTLNVSSMYSWRLHSYYNGDTIVLQDNLSGSAIFTNVMLLGFERNERFLMQVAAAVIN